MSKINIAMGVSDDWFQYSLVTITSILINADVNDKYSFYILSNNFTDEVKKAFLALKVIVDAEFNFLLINDEDFNEFPGVKSCWLGVSAAYRLKIFDLINESKILYLDSDIIVNKNIRELYEYDISNYYVAGVEDKCNLGMKIRANLGKGHTYINSGVLLMNLDLFRRDNLPEKIFDKLRMVEHYNDQDVINDICQDSILQLPIRYNFMPVFEYPVYPTKSDEVKEALYNPFIIHYTKKPWNDADVHLSNFWFFYKNIFEEIMRKENIQ